MLPLGVVAAVENFRVDGVAQRLPPVGGSVQVGVAAHGGDHPVCGDPGHHLGMGEVPPRAAHLPQPVVGLGPIPLEVVHQRNLQIPRVVVGADPRVAR